MAGGRVGAWSLLRLSQDAVQPGVGGGDGVGVKPVPDVCDLRRGEVQPGAARAEDGRVGFGGASLAGCDDFGQVSGESHAGELAALLIGVTVGEDPQPQVAVLVTEGAECRADVWVGTPGGLVVAQVAGEPGVGARAVPVAEAEFGGEGGNAQAALSGEGELSGQVALHRVFFELLPAAPRVRMVHLTGCGNGLESLGECGRGGCFVVDERAVKIEQDRFDHRGHRCFSGAGNTARP
jgi:hypothetical protein